MSRSRLYPPSVDPGFPTLLAKPEGWVRAPFDSVVEVVERPLKLDPTRVYKTLTAKRNRGGIVLRDEILGKDILTKTQFEAKSGDFVISRRQIIHGACAVVPPDLDGAVVSNEYSTLRTRDGVLMEFLRHYSHTPYFQRTCFHSSHGVDVEKMIFKIDEWLAREVDVPPVAEQRKIAAILSGVDDAIAATETVIDQLQVVKTAMMTELLTRGIPGRHTRFKQTEFGEVPESWDVVTMDQLAGQAGMVGGPFGSDLTTKDYVPSGVPVIRGGNVSMGRFVESDYVYVSSEKASALARNTARGGDIVMTQRGVSLGEATLIPLDAVHDFYVISQTMMRMTPDTQAIDSRFLMHFTCSPVAQAWLQQHQIATGQPHLNLGIYRKMPAVVPDRAEQASIALMIDGMDRAIDGNVLVLEHQKRTKFALMSVLLTGEVRVTPDEVAA